MNLADGRTGVHLKGGSMPNWKNCEFRNANLPEGKNSEIETESGLRRIRNSNF
jgi:hypothetical protein